jgi:hypothetical protein
MCISAAILAAGALTAGGAVVASKGAGKAADAQVGAARDAAQLQNEQFQQSRADMQPFLDSGYRALAAQNFELGLGPRPQAIQPQLGPDGQPLPQNALAITESQVAAQPGAGSYVDMVQPNSRGGEQMVQTFVPSGPLSQFSVGDQNFDTREAAQAFINSQGGAGGAGGGMGGAAGSNALNFDYGGFKETPGYQFRVDQGRQAIERSAAARGGLNSGATMRALQGYGQGMAADEYGTFYNRLGAMSGTGQTQVNSLASLGANSAANQGNSLMQAGNARASGYANQANIFGGAASQIAGGIGNYIGSRGPTLAPASQFGGIY